jgi:hypothetical protein
LLLRSFSKRAEVKQWQDVFAWRGDSFGRGYGTSGLTGGGFADQVSPLSWFYPVRSPAAIMNLLLSVNGPPYTAYYAGLLFPATGTGFPYTMPTIEQDATAKRLGEGDIIVCEDAGSVPANPDDYLADWINGLTAAKNTGARVIALTMYDTSQSSWQALSGLYGSPPADSRFDVAAVGSPSGVSRTPNHCIRDAAAAVGGVDVYEFGADALSFATWCRGNYLLRAIQDDWVHNNLWTDGARGVAICAISASIVAGEA